MFQRVQEYLKKRRWERYRKRRKNWNDELKNAPTPNWKKLKENARWVEETILQRSVPRSSVERSNNNLKFEISGNDYDSLKKFEKQHKDCKCGVAWEKFSYHFTPSGMGLAISVTCSCRQNLLLGNFMDGELPEYDKGKHKVLTENDLRRQAFEQFVQRMRKMRNPRMFQVCWAKPQNFDTVYAYAVGAATYSGVEGLIVQAIPYAEEMGAIYYNGTDAEKMERFYELFEEKVQKIESERRR